MVFVSRIGRRSDATVVQLSAVQHCEQKKIQKGQVFYPHPALLHTGKKNVHISQPKLFSQYCLDQPAADQLDEAGLRE